MEITKVKNTKKGHRLTVWRYLALGYFIIILLGSILLILPFATKDGQKTNYLNALFTATSASCVTGLVPYDTGIHWSTFGQIVILLLIQMGGLGFTTFVSIVFLFARRELGVQERKVVMQSYGGQSYRGIGTLIKRIMIGSLLIEFIGASLLCISFVPKFGGMGVYYAVFHSVSAFCNAGFDLMGAEYGEFVSLTHFATDPVVSLVIPVLIILGGLGFCVWGDVIDCKFNFKKFRLFTQVVLIMTAVLLVGGTGLFLLFERNNPSYAGYHFGQKLMCSFFNAATARTAGFASASLDTLSDSGFLLMLVLMFIGGSSGSTAGGIKVSTFAVIVMGMLAAFRGRKDVNIGRKRLEPELVAQALAIFAAYLMLALTATVVICAIEPEGQFKEILFETVSAIGTVGLSVSLTPSLTIASKIILIVLMYTGRVGILTLALALGKKRSSNAVRKPAESLFIG